MAAPSSTLAWRIPWAEEPAGLQPVGLQRVGHDRVSNTSVLLLGVYSEKTMIPEDTCPPMFTAAVFTTGHGSNLDVHRQIRG